MIDISIRGLTKAFEVNNNILDGLSFQVQHGERVGIVGRNGTGKTTLFRLMVGELIEDKGDIDIARGKRLGLVSQIPHYPEGYTVESMPESTTLSLPFVRFSTSVSAEGNTITITYEYFIRRGTFPGAAEQFHEFEKKVGEVYDRKMVLKKTQ